KEGQAKIAGGQDVQGPAHMIHGDYTLRSAPDRLQQLAQVPSGNDTLKGFLPEGTSLIPEDDAIKALEGNRRFAIINVWRNIVDEPVATHPLALCDSQTVSPEDLVVFEIHYSDRIGENYFAKYSPVHKMYYYPEITRDEALLIKQWDSAGALASTGGEQGDAVQPDGPCTFSFHSAFSDPTTPEDAPDRWSIEVRCMVVYP
ncbi:MAG: CmcJ/NvfI family oxidoreductase, partial [Pseudomonadota bacterium]